LSRTCARLRRVSVPGAGFDGSRYGRRPRLPLLTRTPKAGRAPPPGWLRPPDVSRQPAPLRHGVPHDASSSAFRRAPERRFVDGLCYLVEASPLERCIGYLVDDRAIGVAGDLFVSRFEEHPVVSFSLIHADQVPFAAQLVAKQQDAHMPLFAGFPDIALRLP